MFPEVAVNPNWVYLMLLFGLWASVTAAYVPGTGISELTAFVALGGSVVLLAGMPTRWAAVIVLVAGVLGFIIIPFLSPRRAQWAEYGLVLHVLGSVFLFDGLSVSWLWIAFTAGLSLLYQRYMLQPVLERHGQLPLLSGDTHIVGARGAVISPLDPVGTVQVNGEPWTAASDVPLETGAEVQVISREGLRLYVEPLKVKNDLSAE